MTTIPDEAINMAMGALIGAMDDTPWWRARAEAALSAALPHIEAAIREQVAQEIEAAYREWRALGPKSALSPPMHSSAWLVERAYAYTARIARGADR